MTKGDKIKWGWGFEKIKYGYIKDVYYQFQYTDDDGRKHYEIQYLISPEEGGDDILKFQRESSLEVVNDPNDILKGML